MIGGDFLTDYFSHIVKRLTFDDISILSILSDSEATAKFKSLKKSDLSNDSGLTEANFRKAIYRLDAINFVETVTGHKEHRYYITELGMKAISESLFNENVLQ